MLDCITHPLKFPSYSSVKHYEGKGNWTVEKYYKLPYRFFYRHKIRMIERMLRGRKYKTIVDFGCGPGLFKDEWLKYGKNVHLVDTLEDFRGHKADLTVCSSVMEFVNLDHTFMKLAEHTNRNGDIIVASPMATELSEFYFNLIGDRTKRNTHQDILSAMSKHFDIRNYKHWMDLYFCVMGKKR